MFATLYKFFESRRAWLFAGTVVLIVMSAVGVVTTIDMEEDIAAMLPDDDSGVARDFELLQHAPFAKKVLINIQSGNDDVDGLIKAADRLKAKLTKPNFDKVTCGVDPESGIKLMDYLTDSTATLISAQDLKAIEANLTLESVAKQVKANKRALMNPDAFVSKKQLLSDPLNIRRYNLAKLRHINLVPNVRLENNHFVSKDGRNTLLIAETSIPITDSKRGKAMMVQFEEACRELPDGYTATLLSGHRYTLANANTIQRDLSVILGISTVAIICIFLIYLRSWRAVFVFLLPASVMGFAILAVSICFREVSAITIGFGAVLLGMAVDFALHTYFALKAGDKAEQVIGGLTRPILFCGLTTIGAFAVLLFSALPGQRQLAVFSITGLVASLLMALIVLPHLMKRGGDTNGASRMLDMGSRLPRKPVLIVWTILLCSGAALASRLQFDGNMRNLGVVPEEIASAEKQVQDVWGNYRSKAMVFSEGSDLQAALAKNDELFAYLQDKMDSDALVSLSPILPAFAEQQSRINAWKAFWAENGAKAEALLIEANWSRKAAGHFRRALQREWKAAAPETMAQIGLGDMMDSMIVRLDNRVLVMSMVPDSATVAALFNGGQPEGCHMVSQTRTGAAIGQAISKSFRNFMGAALVMVIVLVVILFRQPRQILCALAPVLTGLLCMFGVMVLLDMQMNLFNVVAAILVIGLGVDYGIFMVHRSMDTQDLATSKAVWVSGLTTLAGFGGLMFGRHPALRSIGMTVGIGIFFAIAAALLVVPALAKREMV